MGVSKPGKRAGRERVEIQLDIKWVDMHHGCCLDHAMYVADTLKGTIDTKVCLPAYAPVQNNASQKMYNI